VKGDGCLIYGTVLFFTWRYRGKPRAAIGALRDYLNVKCSVCEAAVLTFDPFFFSLN
jgi:hypothetical protein